MSVQLIILAVVGVIILQLVRPLITPLRSVGGPFLARFTDLCFNDPEALKIIYGPGSQFRKSDWYDGNNVPKPMAYEKWNMFTTTDPKQHSEQRKPFTNAYSMTSLVSFEPYVDECADIFEQRLTEVAGTAVPIDFGHWLQCYAFDVIGDITFGERFGFLDSGRDIGGVISALDDFFDYAATIGVYPRLHPIMFKLQTMLAGENGNGFNYINNFTQSQITKFRDDPKSSEKAALQDEGSMETMLAKFFRRNQEDHKRFTSYHTFIGCAQNVGAGSDTTAISLSATFYYLLKNPSTLQRLREEVLTKAEQGQLSEKPTFKETLDMPYLQAVIKEALRLHPATGLPLERVVPEGGATISGRFFPAGTIVGVNTWVEHRNSSIWDDDANEFRPERWLIDDSEKLSFMNRHWIPFGVGSRVCIGKNISLLEMQKLIPRVIRKFDLEIDGPRDKTWSTRNRWFVKPHDFRVQVSVRKAE
ncbi:hypothetical protein G7054_g10901 [Neopestalotiopsis clavispora]|nr:hypothetical protein G7054_g10901 [Neopestalotiopsis clavispora]